MSYNFNYNIPRDLLKKTIYLGSLKKIDSLIFTISISVKKNNYTIQTTIMSTEMELLAERVASLEKKIELLMANQTDEPNKDKNQKKDKKTKKTDDSPKKKRINGYFLFNSAHREEAKTLLAQECKDGEKVKNTDIIKKLAAMWSDIGDEGKAQWNTKAAQMKESETSEE